MPAATLEKLPATASVEDVCDIIERDGGVIVEDFADSATLDALWHDIGPDLERQAFGDGEFVGSRTRRVASLFRRSMHSADLITRPQFIGAARHFLQQKYHAWLGEERMEITASFQVGVTQAIQIWPGESAQALHRDDTQHLRTHPGPQSRVQLMLALSDFTAENGGTLVIPGSHRWADERAPRLDEAVPTVMARGSALIWLGSTYHGGGSNVSDGPRTGLTYGFDLGNVRQEENQYVAVPNEILRAYPEEIQRLLGWEMAPPFVGFYEMNDPVVLLKNGRTEGLTSRDATGGLTGSGAS